MYYIHVCKQHIIHSSDACKVTTKKVDHNEATKCAVFGNSFGGWSLAQIQSETLHTVECVFSGCQTSFIFADIARKLLSLPGRVLLARFFCCCCNSVHPIMAKKVGSAQEPSSFSTNEHAPPEAYMLLYNSENPEEFNTQGEHC